MADMVYQVLKEADRGFEIALKTDNGLSVVEKRLSYFLTDCR